MIKSETLQGQTSSYKITQRRPFALGRLGALFEAEDERRGTVCVKLFTGFPETAAGVADIDEFLRELAAQKRLKHPNILPLLDYGVSEEGELEPFIVYPLCRLGNLRKRLIGKSYLPIQEALPILQQVASAIDFAHDSGVIHGDVKPENILFLNQDHATLTDFGMSRYFKVKEDITTTTFDRGGSTAYLSPEQIAEGKQSPRSDIYSLAIVAFEMLAGSLPFDTKKPPFHQLLAKVEGKLIDPIEANPNLPEHAAEALRSALEVRRERRPGSASGFCQLLKHPMLDKKSRVLSFGWWKQLDTKYKIAIIIALIGALAGIIEALLQMLSDLV